MPDRWNPIEDVRKRYPGLKDWGDGRILENMSDPAKFRSAFPEYAHLDDERIKSNVSKLQETYWADQQKDKEPQGHYLMRPKGGGKPVSVLYGKVGEAKELGYDFTDPDLKRQYEHDVAHGPKVEKENAPPVGLWANVKAELKGIPEGAASMLAPPATPAEKIMFKVDPPVAPAAIAAERFAKSEMGSRQAAAEEAERYIVQAHNDIPKGNDLVKMLEYIRGGTTLAASVTPIAGIAGVALNINDAMDRGDISGAWGRGLVDIPLYALGLKRFPGKEFVKEAASKIGDKVVEKVVGDIKPSEVDINGTKVPVTIIEKDPQSRAGDIATNLKKSGVGRKHWAKVGLAQQAALKQVIRDVARETSGMTGPIQYEPGAAMKDAATASFMRAKPIYAAMDRSLEYVPKDWADASSLVKTAIARAEKFGIKIDSAEEEKNFLVDRNGNLVHKLDYGQSTIEKAIKEGNLRIEPMKMAKQPLQTYMEVRSQLLKMQRAALDANDAKTSYEVGKEIRTMNEDAKVAFKDSDMYENWMEANKLWSKGYALSEISDALKKDTEGTPEGVIKDPLIKQVPTEMQGRRLVRTLNTLYDDGILEEAFNARQITNLRECAEIIKRSQDATPGMSSGESISRSRAITHFISGLSGNLTGAAVGGAIGGGIGMLSGSLATGFEMGALLGFAIQKIGEQRLVIAMTDIDGVSAMRALSKAKTPAELRVAMRRLMIVARGVSPAPKKKEEPKKEEKLKDVESPEGGKEKAPEPQSKNYTHVYNHETGQIEAA